MREAMPRVDAAFLEQVRPILDSEGIELRTRVLDDEAPAA
jgi:hypothetical protein